MSPFRCDVRINEDETPKCLVEFGAVTGDEIVLTIAAPTLNPRVAKIIGETVARPRGRAVTLSLLWDASPGHPRTPAIDGLKATVTNALYDQGRWLVLFAVSSVDIAEFFKTVAIMMQLPKVPAAFLIREDSQEAG